MHSDDTPRTPTAEDAAKPPLDFTVPTYFRTHWCGTISYHRVIARPTFGKWTGFVCEVLSISVEEHGLRFKDEVRATAEGDMSRDFEAIEAEDWNEIVARYVLAKGHT